MGVDNCVPLVGDHSMTVQLRDGVRRRLLCRVLAERGKRVTRQSRASKRKVRLEAVAAAGVSRRVRHEERVAVREACIEYPRLRG